MPRFEVFVPAAPPAVPVDLTLSVEAERWLGALRAGLEKLGHVHAPNVLCDVQADGSLHVTDPQGGGVFRVRELGEGSAPPAAAPPAPAAPAARAPRWPLPEPAPEPARIGRPPTPRTPEDVLAALAERVAALDRRADRRSGLGFLLDLALERIACDVGMAFLARLGGSVLELAVARGPRAEETLERGRAVPLGAGIVGFCARENLCLALSDAGNDARLQRELSEAIGHETRSLLCAPVARAGVVLGALEVVNKRGGKPFERSDLAVLSYLARQAAELLARTRA